MNVRTVAAAARMDEAERALEEALHRGAPPMELELLYNERLAASRALAAASRDAA